MNFVKSNLVHPFLFATFSMLFLYSNNLGLISFGDLVPSAMTIFGVIVFLMLLLIKMFKNKEKIGLVLSLLVLVFFSYGHFYEVLEGLGAGTFVLGRHRYLLIVIGLLVTFCVSMISTLVVNGESFARVFNLIGLILIIGCLLNIGVFKWRNIGQWEAKVQRTENIKESESLGLRAVDKLRDVYYIIFDGHASSSTLRALYKYDNHEFITFLEERGFYIADESRSNYPSTFLSLASSLNLEYINYLSEVVGRNSGDRSIPNAMIQDNKVFEIAKRLGYQVVHVGSNWGPTRNNRNANLEIRTGFGNEFELLLIRTSLLKPFGEMFLANSRERILNALSELGRIQENMAPTFTFAHIMIPHPPYLFGESGERVIKTGSEMEGEVWIQKGKYLNQLKFVETKIRYLVKAIMNTPGIAPIIIIQGDHGPASMLFSGNGHWHNPDERMLKERMTIFNAYFLPDGGNEMLYPWITPVNSFRLIFNYYFKGRYELLRDESYYSTYEMPYAFANVTGKIGQRDYVADSAG